MGGAFDTSRNSELRQRTKQFALSCIHLYQLLPRDPVAQILGKQMLRSTTSVGAQYREAHRAKSTADFISKVEGSLQELDETSYWLELLEESGCLNGVLAQPVKQETQELIRIFVTIAKKARSN